MDEYTKKIIYYINNPRFQGVLDTYTHKCSHKSSDCGDWNDIYFNIVDGTVEGVSYENSGCALNIASLELFCEFCLGKKEEVLDSFCSDQISEELDFPPDKSHCIKLIFNTIKKRNN